MNYRSLTIARNLFFLAAGIAATSLLLLLTSGIGDTPPLKVLDIAWWGAFLTAIGFTAHGLYTKSSSQ